MFSFSVVCAFINIFVLFKVQRILQEHTKKGEVIVLVYRGGKLQFIMRNYITYNGVQNNFFIYVSSLQSSIFDHFYKTLMAITIFSSTNI